LQFSHILLVNMSYQ